MQICVVFVFCNCRHRHSAVFLKQTDLFFRKHINPAGPMYSPKVTVQQVIESLCGLYYTYLTLELIYYGT